MKYEQYVILDAVQAVAADLTFDNGELTLLGQAKEITYRDLISARKSTYSAGVLSDKTYDMADFTLSTTRTEYKMVVHTPKAPDGSENNKKTREYYFWSDGVVATTAAAIVDAFVADVNGDSNSLVTAVDAGNSIQLTLDAVASGDFHVRFYQNLAVHAIGETVNTPFTEPQGSPALVEAATGESGVSSTGQYTRYEIDHYTNVRHNEVDGNAVRRKVTTAWFLDEGDGDTAALVVALDTVFNGTYTTAAAYTSVPFS